MSKFDTEKHPSIFESVTLIFNTGYFQNTR